MKPILRRAAALLGGFVLSLGVFSTPLPVLAQEAGFTAGQEKAIRELVLKTIREQPDIILEALKILETRQKAAQAGSVQRVLAEKADDLFRNANDPVGGNPKGDVTLVEFFDYRCGFCKRVHPTIQRLLREDGNIRYVYKEFPILGPSSLFASRAALAAFSLGKYVKFSKALMESRGTLSKSRVFSIAKKSGLDPLRLEREMQKKDAVIKATIQRNYELAQGLDINGTPGFVIGNQVLHGAVDFETLKTAVKKAREAGKKG
ncbi:MAG TPA: DsbA family protein [Rhizobiales bacterium]|nr:DsbA family protein [Hyphomicrobiales bacterium]